MVRKQEKYVIKISGSYDDMAPGYDYQARLKIGKRSVELPARTGVVMASSLIGRLTNGEVNGPVTLEIKGDVKFETRELVEGIVRLHNKRYERPAK
jgi:hypothetical protein